MEFNNKLYELRKKKGLSQEELAGKLNVSRQTVSKWELGDSTPDMEKLIALSDLFEISLDELVLGKIQESAKEASGQSAFINSFEEKICTPKNKKKAKKVFIIIGIIFGAVLAVDVISMIVYFCVNGVPQ